MTTLPSTDVFHKKTRLALFVTNILNEPLFVLIGLMAFILRKDLGASPFQIALLTMLRPLVSIFSYYWSVIFGKGDLKINFVVTSVLSCFLFLFFPFVHSSSFVILAGACYMLFSRAGIPPWMEILKVNLPKRARDKIFSIGSAIGYLEGVFLAIGIGAFLDKSPHLWKVLFFLAALIKIGSIFLFLRIPINVEPKQKPVLKRSLREKIALPWKESLRLMKARPDFSRFQWGFMLCGFGIMLLQPALPLFFVDKLKLSYMDLAIALSMCKGLGFAISSPIWGKWLGKTSIFRLSFWVAVFFGVFPVLLLLTSVNILWLYIAYALYGVAQGGSHLIWNLSGPIFAGDEDSSLYSGVNVVMVGVRGAIAPPLGGFLAVLLGPVTVLVLGVAFCFYSCFWTAKKKSLEKVVSEPVS